jgi:hypothetical protein
MDTVSWAIGIRVLRSGVDCSELNGRISSCAPSIRFRAASFSELAGTPPAQMSMLSVISVSVPASTAVQAAAAKEQNDNDNHENGGHVHVNSCRERFARCIMALTR